MLPILKRPSRRLLTQTKRVILPALILTSCLSGSAGKEQNKIHHHPFHSSLAFCSARNVASYHGTISTYTTRTTSTSRNSAVDDDTNNDQKNSNSRIEALAQKLVDSKNVVVLVGAGASVSAGIPDFRTPGTGLYSQLQDYNLPFPEAIFDLDYFRQNPMPFVKLCQSIWPGQEGGPRPTLTHAFLKILEQKNCLRRIYTQNIDGLEALAGVSDDCLVECHGHFRETSCISCHAPMDADRCLDAMLTGDAPRCDTCGSLVKPDIVFFGEELPRRFQLLIEEDVAKCDLLLVIGTSLLVMPVASIPKWVSKQCTRALLNREVVGDFVHSSSDRDFYLGGDCDDSVRKLCASAGWQQDLNEMEAKLG